MIKKTNPAIDELLDFLDSIDSLVKLHKGRIQTFNDDN